MSLLSVVIPTYNRRDSLMRTLGALEHQQLGPERFEVIVVSDGATDGTHEAVGGREWPYRLRFVEQSNSGPSVARNRGAQEAFGEVLVYLDDDIEPVPAFLSVHAAAHEAQPDLVLIGPQSMPPGERFPVWIAWEHQMLERQYARFRSGAWEAGPNNLYSGNFSVRREHLLRAGGFDERFKRQEDVELGFRLAGLGLRFRFEPTADGLHRPDRTFESWYATPFTYGRRDVQMARDRGELRAMELARKHYHRRNRITRLLARTCIGRPIAEAALFGFLHRAIPLSERAGMRRVGLGLCSLAFNLRYLQGMAQERGGAKAMWETLGGSHANAES